jgi:hypothetical protein
MSADVGFGWIVFFGLLIWVFQVLRAGGQAGPRRPPSPPRPYRPDATQSEAQRLEQLLRHLEGRLGQEGGVTRTKSTVVIKRPAPPLPRARQRAASPARARAAESEEAQSLEVPVDREAEAEAIERRRLAAVAARSQELTDADHAAFEVRVRADRDPRPGVAPPTTRQLRDAFVWNEILGPPAALRPIGEK